MEYVDLFDDNRMPLNKTKIRGSKLENGENFQVIHVCIFNSKNEMLIQQRQENKKSWANLWDISVGGGCLAGETSRQSAQRELLEELGLNHDFSYERPYLTINFDNGFDDIYFIQVNQLDLSKLTLREKEVKAIDWATKDKIIELIDEGKFIPYYKSFIEALFELKTNRGLYKKEVK